MDKNNVSEQPWPKQNCPAVWPSVCYWY